MLVSVWLRDIELIVSMLVGHDSVCDGVDEGRLMSYMEIEEDETAKTGSVLCRVMLVYAV
jgi:hypothetical protein